MLGIYFKIVQGWGKEGDWGYKWNESSPELITVESEWWVHEGFIIYLPPYLCICSKIFKIKVKSKYFLFISGPSLGDSYSLDLGWGLGNDIFYFYFKLCFFLRGASQPSNMWHLIVYKASKVSWLWDSVTLGELFWGLFQGKFTSKKVRKAYFSCPLIWNLLFSFSNSPENSECTNTS